MKAGAVSPATRSAAFFLLVGGTDLSSRRICLQELWLLMLSGPPQTVQSPAVPIYIDFATVKCPNVNICHHFCLLMILASTFWNEKIQMIWSFVETTLCLE